MTGARTCVTKMVRGPEAKCSIKERPQRTREEFSSGDGKAVKGAIREDH